MKPVTPKKQKFFLLWSVFWICTALILLLFSQLSIRSITENREIERHLKSRPRAAVILCYHDLEARPRTPYQISFRDFSRQMDWIREKGYRVVRLDTLLDLLDSHRPLPDSLVAITFDDGYKSVYWHAWPVLKKHRFPFAVFIYTDYIDRTEEGALSWEQVREMSDSGADIGSHSLSHPKLTERRGMNTGQYQAWVGKELSQSRTEIAKKLGQAVDLFAYPYGAFNDTVQSLAQKAGYRACFLVSNGANDSLTGRYRLDRVIIPNGISLKQFGRILNRHLIDMTMQQPFNGEVVAGSENLVIKGKIGNLPELRRKTIEFQVTKARGKPVVDTLSGEVKFVLSEPLKPGFHEAIVKAVNIYGQESQGRWIFLAR
jgi:peptidoglycan/xylan/chitin deacetylase (PgdA/CDA1 family)